MRKTITITQQQLSNFDGDIEWALADEVLNHLDSITLNNYESAEVTESEVRVLNSKGYVIDIFEYKIEEEIKVKNVMAKAWKIARQGAKKFGGKVSEYFVEALKLAWEIIQGGKEIVKKTVEIVTSEGSRNNKSWVAQIVGTHPRWKFERDFMEEEDDDVRDKTYVLNNGIYEVCDAGDREYIVVENGEVEYVEYDEVLSLVK